MGEVLVSFETAKLAKEVGFNELCSVEEGVYGINSIKFENKVKNSEFYKDNENITTKPTQSLLQKWLREVHKIDIIPTFSKNSRTYGYNMYYTEENKPVYINKNSIKATTYEEALELALYKALTIVKNNENKT